MTWILRHIKRSSGALWVTLVWLEPFGYPAWAVWAYPAVGKEQELSRSRSLLWALWKAYTRKDAP